MSSQAGDCSQGRLTRPPPSPLQPPGPGLLPLACTVDRKVGSKETPVMWVEICPLIWPRLSDILIIVVNWGRMLADDLENPSRSFSALTNNWISWSAPCMWLSGGLESLLLNAAVKMKSLFPLLRVFLFKSRR